jgi:DNA gyrase/topoisomerase IV subunit B
MTDQTIEALNDYMHARICTEMFLSSRDPHTQMVMHYNGMTPVVKEFTWVPAVFTAFREILDNAIDEIITHGHGSQIDVVYDAITRIIRISDNGRGIPITKDEKSGLPLATLALSATKAGRNFRDRGATRGVNGVGASIVNLCSEFFQVTIIRDGKIFTQKFSEGKEDLIIGEPKIKKCTTKPTGTTIEFRLSSKVFPNTELPEEFIASRVFELALSYPQLVVTYQGKKIMTRGGPDKTIFNRLNPIKVDINDEARGFSCKFWLLPSFLETGEYSYGLVNAIPLFNGGVHIDAFRNKFANGIIGALESMSKRRKLTPNKSDVTDGMLLYSIVEMVKPSFDSQSKTRLINEDTRRIVTKALSDENFFKDITKKHKEWIESIYERCAARTMVKDKKTLDDLDKGKKRLKIEELEDASGKDRSKCTLILAEGKSAISGAASARNSEIFGALPLRGKVLNVFNENLATIATNVALSKVASALGLVVGKPANRLNMRYGKLWIACDADADGGNIMSLLINYFYKTWPELFKPASPFIYVFQTPFIIAKKGKLREYWYSDNHEDFKPEEWKGWEITRAKGLAAMNDIDWENSFKKPRLTPIIDNGDLKDCLELLFDKPTEIRKEWLND